MKKFGVFYWTDTTALHITMALLSSSCWINEPKVDKKVFLWQFISSLIIGVQYYDWISI